MNLLIAPPGGGKTTHLLRRAREAAAEGKRVWWVGLPSQRSYVYRRLTEGGAILGVEFLSSQQVYYRLLAHALKLKPLLVGTGRLALVGEALSQLRGELPAPGEARLFAQAVAEAKRYGLGYRDIRGKDEEGRRFREVFRVYEALKGERWDYDDFRTEALRHAKTMTRAPEADLLIVDGFREIGPLELRIHQALSRHAEVWLSLPEAPPGHRPTLTLEPRTGAAVLVYKSPNPVSEARWVLRALKGDLSSGLTPLDLAVILPERQVKAFLALADEYGVPMMDETPKALADSLAGRLLLSLLELADYPTPSRLLAIPDLSPLANAALTRGIAGPGVMNSLADELGLGGQWRKWLALLEAPGDELAWAENLLDTSLPELRGDLLSDARLPWAQFRAQALQRAKEASTLAKGSSFRKWWAALLQETQVFERPRGGVALLTDKLASGRRFRKAYLMHAVEGAYSAREREDYFIPEEDREGLERVFLNAGGLPKRFLGRDGALYAELLERADELVVSYAEADQGGPLTPEPELTLGISQAAPRLLAASRLELATEARYQAGTEPLLLGSPNLERLRRYDDCAFRLWAESRLPQEAKPWWQELLSELRAYPRLNEARLEVLQETYREAAPWLGNHGERLLALQFGVRLPEDGDGPRAYLDAVSRHADEVTLYRFTGPGRVSEGEAGGYIDGRWNELCAAGHLLERYASRISRVSVLVWPVLGEPIPAYDGGVTYLWRRIANRQEKARAAYLRYQQGEVRPNPGFRCRACGVSDLCREGQR